MSSSVRVLVVEHQDTCPPALLGGWLADAGCELEVVRPYVGEDLPTSLTAEGYAALLVLGGSMDAFDATVSWLAPTRALVLDAVEHDVPVLGVCLGHQLAALALGGEVGRNPRGRQAGLRDLGHTAQGRTDRLLGPLTGPGIFSNQDVVTALPRGAVELARASTGELQAARFAPTVWGLQWHPEATRDIFGAWARMDAERHPEDGSDVAALVAEVESARAALDADGRRLAAAFAAVARERG